MEEIDDPGVSDATTAAMYFMLELKDIVASKLPKQEKTSLGVKTSRDLRVQVKIADKNYPLEWKPFAEQISWLKPSDMVSHTAHKESTVRIELYAKFSRGNDQSILWSEILTVEALIERVQHGQPLSVELKPEFDTTPVAMLAFSLSATPIFDVGRGEFKKVILSNIGARERWAKLVDPLRSIVHVGTGIAEVDSNAKIAFSCAKVACDIFLKPFELDEKILKLMSEVEATLRLILEVKSEEANDLTTVQRSSLSDLMRQANECILFARNYSDQSYFKTVGKALVKNYDTIIADYIGVLHSLKQQFNDSEFRDVQVVVHRLESKLQDLGRGVDSLKLDRLRITEGAGRDPNKMCLNGTRVSVLERIHTWIQRGGDGSNARVLLAIGQAGVGKSAVAHTIANEYFKSGRLGAMFCFSKDRGSANVFRTIARNLADIDPVYASELSSFITSDAATNASLQVQMDEVLLLPFKKHSLIGPIIIVLDALDECADLDPLVKCLINNIDSLPKNLRILMTSRPHEAKELCALPWVKVLNLENEPASNNDILLYAQERLGPQIVKTIAQGPRDDPLTAIAVKSEGLFQYASVVCNEIQTSYSYKQSSRRRESPRQTFIRLVRDGKGGLDGLYSGILERLYPSTEANSEELEDFRNVMCWILAAQERLSHNTLIEFGQVLDGSDAYNDESYDRVSMTLRPLGALLSGTQDGSATVYPLHSSIRDYLTDTGRSDRFYIGSEVEQHLSLASISLRLLVAPGRLRFNTAGLENSYLKNDEVPDFEARISAAIPASVSYACTYWATHWRQSSRSSSLHDMLDDLGALMNQKFLFWLEVLALRKEVNVAEDACQILILWLSTEPTVFPVSRDRLELCLRFIHDYGYVIELATPHLYISALPQTPAILDATSHQFSALPQVVRTTGGATASGNSSATDYRTLHGHTGWITSVEFSRDSQYIVTVSGNRTVRIWDAQTYSQVGDLLTGHTDRVCSAHFSPDGTLVVSASYDGTVRIWNAKSQAHEQVGESFTGDPNVEKALFFPNRLQVVSASWDQILFWDAETHAQIAEPLHNRGLAFALSPDGNCIALPTDDHKSMEIVNIQTGARIGECRRGGYMRLESIVFSPDGQRIVTSAKYYDRTIRVWDANTGASINAISVSGWTKNISFFPDGRHIMIVRDETPISSRLHTEFWDLKTLSRTRQDLSMAIGDSWHFSSLSPDGNQLASVFFSSRPYSVRIQNLETDIDDLTPTHVFDLNSASYSSDGKSIITACSDNTIRTWDAETYLQTGNPLAGHTSWVYNAVSSPDGNLILSASKDETVRVWSAETRAQIGEPLTGHTKSAYVAFSPDGTCFASTGGSTIRVWSACRSDLGKLVWAIKIPEPISGWLQPSISFSCQAQFVAVNNSLFSASYVLDLNTGTEASVVPLEYRQNSACFSPNKHLILFYWDHGKNLHLWNVEAHHTEKIFKGHTIGVRRASFSLDGKHIVSISWDQTIRVWNTKTSSQIAKYLNVGKHLSPSDLKTIEVSPNGRHILSVYWDHIQIWAMPDSLPAETNVDYSVDDPNPWCRAVSTSSSNLTSLRGWIQEKQNKGNPESTWKSMYEEEGKELLFCMPKGVDKRSLMWLPHHVGVLLPNRPTIRVMWEESVHGTEWAKCYLGEREHDS